MSRRIFAVGRARRRPDLVAVRPVDSLAAAGRRPGPARRPQSHPTSPTPASVIVGTGWLSPRRLAGRSEFAERASESARLPVAGGPSTESAPAVPAAESASPPPPAHPLAADPAGWAVPIPAVSAAGRETSTTTSGFGPSTHPLRRVVDPAAGHRSSTRTPPKARPDKKRSTARSTSKSRRYRILGWTLLGCGVFLLCGSAWVGWRTYQAYTHLQAASAQVAQLQDQLRDITATDPTATAGTVGELQAEAASARSAVDDPIYRAAIVLPFVGPNLDAIRGVTVTVDSLATGVMPSLVEISRTLQPAELAPKDGVIDLASIERISPLLQSADVAVNDARESLAAIDQSALVQPVGDAVSALTDKLTAAADVIGPGARTARLLPPMLGSEGARNYLVVFQNPAELRATGGIFGSYALVRADGGKITIIDQGAPSRTLGYFDPPVAELSSNELALYSDLMARYPQDVNFTPDYPTAAALFAEMYRVRTGTVTDGVLAIDPVALSYTLEGSPGIDIGQGQTLTSENLVSTLLSTAYQQFEGVNQSERDDFLNNATGKVFSDVMSGEGDPRAIINGLRKAADERRVLIFSSHEGEQADIAKTGLAGSLQTDPEQPSLGIFMNDGTAAKLGYYLNNEVHVTEGACRADGRRELNVRVVMQYDAPSEGLPPYVTATTEPGQPYVLRTNVLAFAPVGGGIVAALRDGAPLAIGRGEDHSREVGTATIELLPGTSTELEFTVLGPAGTMDGPSDIPPALVLTPGVNPWVTSVADYRSCAAPVG